MQVTKKMFVLTRRIYAIAILTIHLLFLSYLSFHGGLCTAEELSPSRLKNIAFEFSQVSSQSEMEALAVKAVEAEAERMLSRLSLESDKKMEAGWKVYVAQYEDAPEIDCRDVQKRFYAFNDLWSKFLEVSQALLDSRQVSSRDKSDQHCQKCFLEKAQELYLKMNELYPISFDEKNMIFRRAWHAPEKDISGLSFQGLRWKGLEWNEINSVPDTEVNIKSDGVELVQHFSMTNYCLERIRLRIYFKDSAGPSQNVVVFF